MKNEKHPTVEISLKIQECEECPFHKSERVWTSDSWDNVRAIKCTKLNCIKVHTYLDWYDKSYIPEMCPFRAEQIKKEKEESEFIGYVIQNEDDQFLRLNGFINSIEKAEIFFDLLGARVSLQPSAGEQVKEVFKNKKGERILGDTIDFKFRKL